VTLIAANPYFRASIDEIFSMQAPHRLTLLPSMGREGLQLPRRYAIHSAAKLSAQIAGILSQI